MNIRFLAFATSAATLSAITFAIKRHHVIVDQQERSLATYIGQLIILLSVWGLTQETYEACYYFRKVLGTHWQLSSFFLITILWHGLATAIWSLGLRLQKPQLRMTAYALGTLASCLLIYSAVDAWKFGWPPIFNIRLVAFVAAAATVDAVALALRRHRAIATPEERFMIMYVGLAAAMLLLWGLTQEAHETCYFYREALGSHWDRWAQMTISLVWSLYGALLLISGISRRHQPLRLTGLGLLGITVLKVFLFDLSFLDASLRILSLGGLGAALIFISWLYSRFGIENAKTTVARS